MRTAPGASGAIGAAVGLAIVLAGCSALGGDDSAARRSQAQTDLASWDRTVAAARAAGEQIDFIPAQELSGMIGDWGDRIDGGNAKLAWGAGLLEATEALPTQTPPDAPIDWPDGSTESFHLLSADAALAQLKADAGSQYPCPGCATPLPVTGASLTTATFHTSRGPVQAPLWEFSIADSPALITYLAIAKPLVVTPGGSYGSPIQAAERTADPRQIVVSFVGAPAPGQGGCSADYTAEAVESETALVVIVQEHSGFNIGPCDAVGYFRTATATLNQPLANRTVLSGGQPIEVLPAGSPNFPFPFAAPSDSLAPSAGGPGESPATK